ncbi:MAG: hypothetical protein RIE52_11955 [Balneola sp.]
MPGGKGNIKPEEGKQFSSDYQPEEKWTEKKALALGEDLIAWLKETDEDGADKGNILVNEFLVVERELYPQLLTYLRDKFSSFSKLYNRAKVIQETKLVKYGIKDQLNASMTKFTLINNHDWKDRIESDNKTTMKLEQITGTEVL